MHRLRGLAGLRAAEAAALVEARARLSVVKSGAAFARWEASVSLFEVARSLHAHARRTGRERRRVRCRTEHREVVDRLDEVVAARRGGSKLRDARVRARLAPHENSRSRLRIRPGKQVRGSRLYCGNACVDARPLGLRTAGEHGLAPDLIHGSAKRLCIILGVVAANADYQDGQDDRLLDRE